MKIYVKPTIEIFELRINENIATNYPDATGKLTVITKYNLSNGAVLGTS